MPGWPQNDPSQVFGLRENAVDDFALSRFDQRDRLVVVEMRQRVPFQAHLMQDRAVEVVLRDDILDGPVSPFVGRDR